MFEKNDNKIGLNRELQYASTWRIMANDDHDDANISIPTNNVLKWQLHKRILNSFKIQKKPY